MEKNEEKEKSWKSGMRQRNSRYTQSTQSFQTAARILDSLGYPRISHSIAVTSQPPCLRTCRGSLWLTVPNLTSPFAPGDWDCLWATTTFTFAGLPHFTYTPVLWLGPPPSDCRGSTLSTRHSLLLPICVPMRSVLLKMWGQSINCKQATMRPAETRKGHIAAIWQSNLMS